MKKNAIIFSNGIKKIPHLASFLPEFALSNSVKSDSVVIGWGYRPSTKKAQKFAQKNNFSYIALEDGFLRSLGLGVNGYPPLAMVCDDLGIYYDSSKPSRLEKLILNYNDDFELNYQAQKAIHLIQKYQLSKYNHALNFSKKITDDRPVTLVIDQTFGDMAVKYGKANSDTFTQMLQCAIDENPHHQIWVKTHPDVLSGKKKGYFSNLKKFADRVIIITDDVTPQSLIEQVENVYCVTSQMGFEALLLGKKVVTFGVPWFAGWGLTDDRHHFIKELKNKQRRVDKSLVALFACAYLQYSRYISPFSGEKTDIFEVIDYLKESKKLNQKLSGDVYCVGMSLWKRAVIKPFFNVPQCRLHFTSLRKLQKKLPLDNAKILVWGNGKQAYLDFAKEHNFALLKMEDGFIRSVGLGSNLVAPLSLVVDDLGIYFNAQSPSRLEQILQQSDFTQKDLLLAQKIKESLIAQNIGKYNVGSESFEILSQGKKVILVSGQVEDDASIKFGSPEITTNLALLQKVRELNNEAYIIYKPHPDVVSKNRNGKIDKKIALKFADIVLEKVNILDLINQVDGVHTMTSLAGFEALLRGKKVVCYGLPFYSNWGLTEDRIVLPRRNKILTLNELIAGVMIYYPQYIDPKTGHMINALQAIDILKAQKDSLKHSGFNRMWIAKQWFKLQQILKIVKNI